VNIGLLCYPPGKTRDRLWGKERGRGKSGSLLLSKTGRGCCQCYVRIREEGTAIQLGKLIYTHRDSSSGLCITSAVSTDGKEGT